MATKKNSKTKEQELVSEMPVEVKTEIKKNTSKKEEMMMTTGWILLLVGGLAHMLPTQMEPLLRWSMWGVSVQMAVGVLSVIVALYYLLGE